jgi:hypothetical protein
VRAGLLKPGQQYDLPRVRGSTAVLAGSCSVATQGQVAEMKKTHAAFGLDPLAIAAGRDQAKEALAWADTRLGDKPVLIYSTAAPEQVVSKATITMMQGSTPRQLQAGSNGFTCLRKAHRLAVAGARRPVRGSRCALGAGLLIGRRSIQARGRSASNSPRSP